MAIYKSTLLFAALWLLTIIGLTLRSTNESLFDRVLSVVILGILPCAITWAIAQLIKITFAWLSLVFDPVEARLLLFGALGVALFCETRAQLQDGWSNMMSVWWPRLQLIPVLARRSLRQAADAAFRLSTVPIRVSARFLLTFCCKELGADKGNLHRTVSGISA